MLFNAKHSFWGHVPIIPKDEKFLNAFRQKICCTFQQKCIYFLLKNWQFLSGQFLTIYTNLKSNEILTNKN